MAANNRWRGPALRIALGAAGIEKDYAPASPIELSGPAPQLQR